MGIWNNETDIPTIDFVDSAILFYNSIEPNRDCECEILEKLEH